MEVERGLRRVDGETLPRLLFDLVAKPHPPPPPTPTPPLLERE